MGSKGSMALGADVPFEMVARSKALEIDAPPGERSPCILDGHDHSARLHPNPSRGHWQYRCDGGPGHGLGEIRAFLAYHDMRFISNIEGARWHELLDYEAGLLVPRPVPPLPPGLSPTAVRVGEAWRLLVGLRHEMFGGQPFVFARQFVMAWCDVTDKQARAGVEELERVGVMRRVGKHKRCVLWEPGGELRVN